MRRAVISYVLALGLVSSGCGGLDHGRARRVGEARADGTSAPTADRRYEANTMVLQAPDTPAKLCLGAIATSLPPQCGDVPILNWDWDQVESEQRLSGVTWGEYHVVGTYDGASFQLLEVGPPQPGRDHPSDPIETPCPEPQGGWVASDPSRTADRDLQAATRLAEAQPDSAGVWIDYTVPPREFVAFGPGDIVLTAAFTGDIDRHQQELASVWGGPLCVTLHERTQSELSQIQEEITDHGAEDFGIQVLYSSTDIPHNQVEIGIVVLYDATQAAVDERYGHGVVRLNPALRPVA
jgi:hypothetical protein